MVTGSVSYKTPVMLLIVMPNKSIVGVSGKNLRKSDKIHCHLRNVYM
jgi:hypothetical protein